MTARAVNGVRILLTVALVIVLAALGLWEWAWLGLGTAAFSEFAAIGCALVEKSR